MKNIEQELKSLLTAREYEILLEISDTQPQLQTNYYFRCEKMSPEIMVRIRKKGDGYLLCFKNRLSEINGVTVCDERECEIGADYAQNLIARGITPDELKRMLSYECASGFTCVGRLDTYRAKFKLQNWTLELDKNEYLGVTDYELECEDNDTQSLQKLKNYLLYNYGVVFKPSQSKSKRFFDKYGK